ncbi:preprotein translocase subunit YajC [Leucobacter luti]|uniref:preprotein translocase subunit YajC n=1 Tax=Leucobacter luti TaxID=340320 RepID=UPI001046B707|nr:preprotein translocase subunit YajC [Leucobacter luti]MCW2287939.1 preprotein translocase subunit YajC [Leucobacter luti]TCK45899.1 preprotein translocase subunit YajC [Leucobacter luti]
MAIDPITLLMFALIALLIFFMFRNGKKRQAAMQELQSGLRPGAEVMLQSGIFGTIDSVDEEDNKVTVRSGTSTFVVHRNAISQIVAPVDAPADVAAADLAPDDDPAFGERLANGNVDAGVADASDDVKKASDETIDRAANESDIERPDADNQGGEQTPKA